MPGLRAQVHDPSVAPRDHAAAHGLGDEEQPLEVDVHDLVPVGLGDLEGVVVEPHAGVVDQHVDSAVLGLDGGDRRVDRGLVGHVELDGRRRAATGGHLGEQVRHVVGLSGRGDHVRPGRGQREHQVVPDPA